MATKKKNYAVQAIGRRKTSVARVRLVEGKDEIVINGLAASKYWPGLSLESLYLEPFRTTNMHNKYTATAKIIGGGRMGQLQAFVHGVARALSELNPEKNRPILKKRGLLTRDPRMKETRKAGSAGSKARAKRQSPKR